MIKTNVYPAHIMGSIRVTYSNNAILIYYTGVPTEYYLTLRSITEDFLDFLIDNHFNIYGATNPDMFFIVGKKMFELRINKGGLISHS